MHHIINERLASKTAQLLASMQFSSPTRRQFLQAAAVGAAGAVITSRNAFGQASPTVLRATSLDGSITIGTTPSRVAGAIDYVTWNGTQFINSYDHGRELQYAWQINGLPAWNPTEAGSGADGTGSSTSSVFTGGQAINGSSGMNGTLSTYCYPALFYPYNPPYGGTETLSPEFFSKTVTVGLPNIGCPNALLFQATINIPNSQAGYINQFRVESPTPYLNGQFNTFYLYNPASGIIQQQNPAFNTENESGTPPIIATSDGNFAMGVYSPYLPQSALPNSAYVLNNYLIPSNPAKSCTKIAAVFYTIGNGALPPGNYSYTSFVLVGNLARVKNQMTNLYHFYFG